MRLFKRLIYLTISSLILVSCSLEGESKVNSTDTLPSETNVENNDILKIPIDTITNNKSNDNEGDSTQTDAPLDKEMNGTAGQLYGYTFEAMMQLDEGLNGDMQYIAVDLSPLTQLTETDKLYILNYLEQQFEISVQDTTIEQLKEKEDFKKNKLVLKGVLLRIDKVELGEDTAIITGSKYRSGSGGVGTKIDLILEKGSWKVGSAVMTWIS